MKNFAVTVIRGGTDEMVMHFTANHIQKVIDALALDLADQNCEVVSIVETAPFTRVIL